MLADTAHAKARAAQGEDQGRGSGGQRLHRFSPVYFFCSSSFFFPRGLGTSLCFVVVCYILFSPWPPQIKLPFKRQTWMHSRSPSSKQFYFYPYIYLVLFFHSLGVRGKRTRCCDHPDVRGEDKCFWSPPVPRLQQHPSHMAIAPCACSIHQC